MTKMKGLVKCRVDKMSWRIFKYSFYHKLNLLKKLQKKTVFMISLVPKCFVHSNIHSSYLLQGTLPEGK